MQLDLYQLMPSLSDEEYAALKADIAARGVLVPVELDESGNTLDGHHRRKICDELGITDYPTLIRAGFSEEEKRAHVIALNLYRRHLSQEKRAPLLLSLREQGWTYQRIADVAGVSDDTVRRDISVSAIAETELPERVTGKDGKSYPATKPRKTVYVRSEKERENTLDLLGKLDAESESGEKDELLLPSDLRKQVRTQDRARIEGIQEPAPAAAPAILVSPGDWWRLGNHLLYCGDSSSKEFKDRAPACPFAFADPPYNVGKADWDIRFLWAHDWLTDTAEVVAVTPGTKGLQGFFGRVQMPYRWIFTAWIKNGMTVGGMGFQNALHAFLFSHGSVHRNEQDFMQIVVDNSETSDTLHPSRKPAKFVARLMQIYTTEGDSVIDPFLGSGTTLFAAEQMNRAAYGAEIDPLYCAEIITRWQSMAGQNAVKEGGV